MLYQYNYTDAERRYSGELEAAKLKDAVAAVVAAWQARGIKDDDILSFRVARKLKSSRREQVKMRQ